MLCFVLFCFAQKKASTLEQLPLMVTPVLLRMAKASFSRSNSPSVIVLLLLLLLLLRMVCQPLKPRSDSSSPTCIRFHQQVVGCTTSHLFCCWSWFGGNEYTFGARRNRLRGGMGRSSMVSSRILALVVLLLLLRRFLLPARWLFPATHSMMGVSSLTSRGRTTSRSSSLLLFSGGMVSIRWSMFVNGVCFVNEL